MCSRCCCASDVTDAASRSSAWSADIDVASWSLPRPPAQERKCSTRTLNQAWPCCTRSSANAVGGAGADAAMPEDHGDAAASPCPGVGLHVPAQVLAHPDPTTPAGRRDAVMLSMLYPTPVLGRRS